jgi:Mn-dependent DtxR family transcriptional regulator
MANANRVKEGLTLALSGYLLAVDELVARNKLARLRDIAAMRCVRPPAARRAVVRLADLGLVVYRKGEYLDITEAGRTEATRIRCSMIAEGRKSLRAGELSEDGLVAIEWTDRKRGTE